MTDFDKAIRKAIRESFGKNTNINTIKKNLDEAYVTQAKKFNLTTELLSEKNKKAHQELFEKYVDTLNRVSAELDGANRADANSNHSTFRSLKIDETFNLNGAFLHGLFFENISDPQSQLTMDSLTFMRLERDFGTFDAWQKDFIACAMSARSGWAVTVYNTFLNRYMNVVCDLQSLNVPFSAHPVIVLDMWEHSYYRDYLNDKKAYIFAMMKELDWDIVEKRVKNVEKIGKVLK